MRRFDSKGYVRAHLRSFVHWAFADRNVVVHSKGRVRSFSFGRSVQAGLAIAGLMAGAWVAFLSISYFELKQTIKNKDVEIARSLFAYDELVDEMGRVRERFDKIAQSLEKNHAGLVELLRQNGSLRDNLKSVRGRLEISESERARAIDRRLALAQKFHSLEQEMSAMENRNWLLSTDMSSLKGMFDGEVAERKQIVADRERLQGKVGALETRLSHVKILQAELLGRITNSTKSSIEWLEKIIADVGLDARKFLAKPGARATGQGGPFIPLALPGENQAEFKSSLVALGQHLDRWGSMQALIRRLPLSPPLDYFSVASRFGKRRDPFNKRWAMHRGVDLGGWPRSPVYSPAPGVVKAAGRNGRFGRYIEIDHGKGITTRYGPFVPHPGTTRAEGRV